ncbi:hypothetical protein EGW08_016278 [Elysia chlorotica]|uniref:Carbohydrate sulfotransferase n=1 Tax=Elysia chlorotica TaxID=188477 RepID=A0A433T336_ELYCH|nr:hypothetical protein EGW08_016278 [Elysia chlorotica]
MRITARFVATLAALSVLLPFLAMVLWSNGKSQTMPRTVQKMEVAPSTIDRRENNLAKQWYEDQRTFHADIFRPVPVEPAKPQSQSQPDKPLGVGIPRPLPRKPLLPAPRDPPKTLHRENPLPINREPPKPIIKENSKPINREPPKPVAVENSLRAKPEPAAVKVDKTPPRDSGKRAPPVKVSSQWWKQHLRQACRDLKMANTGQRLTKEMLSKVLVDDKNKLVFCQIPKVASTTWRRIFLQLTGKVNVPDFMAISANDVHHKYDSHLTYLSEFSDAEIQHRLRTYFKFMFVREPFERVLSAYRNKFAASTRSSEYFKWKFGRKIIDKYRKPWLIPTNNTGENVTFEEFVTYLVDDRRRVIMNEHWELFHKLCHPCIIDYDFVGHLERIDDDSQFILDSNNLSDRIKVPSRIDSKYSLRDTNSYMQEYYSELPPYAVAQIYRMYQADFILFNYTVPEEIKPYL